MSQQKELGQRTKTELESLFGNMYSGWERGVVVTHERFGTGDTLFSERPMTPLELAARYVAAEIGANIYEIAGQAAFAPIITFSQIQVHVGPIFKAVATERDALVKALDDSLVTLHGLIDHPGDPESWDDAKAVYSRLLPLLDEPAIDTKDQP